MRLEPGDAIPHFDRPDETGTRRTKDEFLGTGLVVFFYPRAFTPGCTVESCEFRDRHAALARAGFQVVGASPDPVARLGDFKMEHALPYPLLSDEDHSMAEAFGAWGVKRMYGKEHEGIIRSTIAAGPDGIVRHAWYNVRAAGHVARVARELAAE